MNEISSLGKILLIGALIIGKQAQMIPTFASIVVHSVETSVSYGWSTPIEAYGKVTTRMQEAMITLTSEVSAALCEMARGETALVTGKN